MSSSAKSKLSFRQKLRQSLTSKQHKAQTDLVHQSAAQTTTNDDQIKAPVPPDPGAKTSSTTSSDEQHVAVPLSLGQSILFQAMQGLSPNERATLQKHTSSSQPEIDHAISQSILAMQEKRKTCLEKRWTCTIAGRHIILREVADKAIHWLDRFKSIGDVAANADPIHIGLPWAGIRVLLEVFTSESKQMAALITGSEAALFLASRLRAYVDFLDQLPAGLSQKNLEESIILLYSHVLSFLAHAIQTYQKSSLSRIATATVRFEEVIDFEKQGNELSEKIERDASQCDRDMDAQGREHVMQVARTLQQTLTELQQLRQISASLDRIELRIDLNMIPHAGGAILDSFDGVHTACHPATRLDILADLQQWARQSDGKMIFWLKGAAGVGKSTISWTFAHWLKENGAMDKIDLGASFFFKRGEGERGSAVRFFPTIVRQLIVKIPGLDVLVSDVIKQDPFIFEKALAEQFRKLLLQPLQHASLDAITTPTLVVVVDALDECDNDKHIEIILQLWSQLSNIKTVPIRLFLTARAEQSLRSHFQGMSDDLFNDIVLQDVVPQKTIEHDLSIYLQDRFSIIRHEYLSRYPLESSLDQDWPGDDVLHTLTTIARPLFIVAATICRFVDDPEFDPDERLQEFLDHSITGQLEQMEMTYLPVLKHLTASVRSDRDKIKLCEDFRSVVGSIICFAEPLSVLDIGTLLNKPTLAIQRRLSPLHSVLQIPRGVHQPVQTLHASFAEFLLSEPCQRYPFGISAPDIHLTLLENCLRLLSGPDGLRENICGLDSPGRLRNELNTTAIEKCLPPVLRYACRYWVHHCQYSCAPIANNGSVHIFLRTHFLHWLEVLSIIGQLSSAIGLLSALQPLLSTTDSNQLSLFIEDARRFTLVNRHVIDQAPLQLYSSALAFSPQESVIRRQCGPMATWLHQTPATPLTWGPEIQTLEGHSDWVVAVAFSPDDSLLASTSEDKTVRLWQVSTGQELQCLSGHTSAVRAVCFSTDGTLLASASHDHTVRLWQVSTGHEFRKLDGHDGGVLAISFASGDMHLVSVSQDRTIRMWEIVKGQEIGRLAIPVGYILYATFSHSASLLAIVTDDGDHALSLFQVNTGQEIWKCKEGYVDQSPGGAVAFSPDDRLLASRSSAWSTDIVRFRKVSTGQEARKPLKLSDWISAVAFSPNGLLFALATTARKLHLWRLDTDEELQHFEGHTSTVEAMTFSSNRSMLASASADKTIRLWQVDMNSCLQDLDGAATIICQKTLSSDGQLLVTAYYTGQVRLWQTSTGQEVRELKGLDKEPRCIQISPDDSVIASGSIEGRVCLWQLSTGQELLRLELDFQMVESLAFTPDGLLLATFTGKGVRLWQVHTGQEVQRFERGNIPHILPVLAFSHDGSLLALAGAVLVEMSAEQHEQHKQWTIQVWQVSSGKPIRALRSNIQGISAVIYSPTGSLLALASQSEPVSLWQVKSITEGHEDEVMVRISEPSLKLDNVSVIIDGQSLTEGCSASILPSGEIVSSKYSLHGAWISHNDQKLLWLPHEYRDRDMTVIHGDTIAVGHSHNVGFLTLKYS